MPCYHPVPLYRSKWTNPETGKNPLVGYKPGLKLVQVPCGRCIGCRLERSRQQAMRMTHELKMHEQSCYITLTYRDDQLIYGGQSHGILHPDHVTKFLKRLRKRIGKFRYYYCGEYGDIGNRPHYHAIIFGLDFQDKKLDSVSKLGDNYYHSDLLDDIWSHGRCIIGDVTFESCAYVARYVMKKRMGKTKETYEKDGIHPEFARMSLKPGIGAGFLEKYQSDIYPRGSVLVRGHESKTPRYYDVLYERSHPLDMEEIKKRRAELAEKNYLENEPKRLKTREAVKKAATKTLQRPLS